MPGSLAATSLGRKRPCSSSLCCRSRSLPHPRRSPLVSWGIAGASLPSELERILGYVTRPITWSLSAPHPGLADGGDALAAQTAQALEACGTVLLGGTPPDLVGLQAARLANRLALDRWAADALQAGSQPEEVLAGFDAGNLQHVVTLLVLALGADALLAMGHPLPAQLQTPADREVPLLGQVHTLTAAYAQLGNQLDQASTGQPQEQQVDEAVLQAAMVDALRRWKEDPAAEQAAVVTVVEAARRGDLRRDFGTGRSPRAAAVMLALCLIPTMFIRPSFCTIRRCISQTAIYRHATGRASPE